MVMKVAIVPVTPLAQNCSLVWCSETMGGAIIDPGGDVAELKAAIEETGMKPERVLITHGHFDHAGGARELADALGVPVEGPHKDDKFWLDMIESQGQMYNVPGGINLTPERWLEAGEQVGFGNVVMDVFHCPGHTPGHVVFVEPNDKIAFVGDVIFLNSIGRTDFPRGDHAALITSIRETLFPLGDDVSFVPGHGARSTFGAERKSNPYVSDDAVKS